MSDSLFASSGGIDPDVVEAARLELAAKLPELRELPGFPVGTDEDILRMSVPPYYTACPNPFIGEWLEGSAPEGYTDREYVDPGPFASDVSESKGHRFYKAHSYWTKVPHKVIMRYILHYTRPGDVVLDGFAGSGMTGVASQACAEPEPEFKRAVESEMGGVEWGARRAVVSDLAPVASFIAAGLNLPIDGPEFASAARSLLTEFEEEWGWLYETTHVDGSRVPVDFTVWSEVLVCPSCGSSIDFYEAAFDPAAGIVASEFKCPNCGGLTTKKSADRRMTTISDPFRGPVETALRVPAAIHYRVGRQKHTKVPDEHDLRTIQSATEALADVDFPTDVVPYHYRMMWLRPIGLASDGKTRAHQFYPERSLLALSWFWSRCSTVDDPTLRLALCFWAEQAVWGLSWMNKYKPNDFSQVNRLMSGVYYVGSVMSECSPRYNLEGTNPNRGKLASLSKTWDAMGSRPGQVAISTGSSEDLPVPDASVDYVFVDPPFGSNFYYADLNYLIESWHGVLTNDESEGIVNQSKPKQRSADGYGDVLAGCFGEFYRVLKPGRWMTVEFSNSSNEIWLALQEAITSAGFVVADTRILDKQQSTFAMLSAKNAVKRDLIISCYKPSSETVERFGLVAGSPDGAWEFVSEHLSHLPVVEGRRGEGGVVRERFADRLYDRMVAYHVHRSVSVPLTASEFYAGVEQRFPVRDDMYFLAEQVEAYERHRMTFGELAQLEFFITGEASAVQWLRQLLKKKPRTYAEIHPLFLAELQDAVSDWEELPELRDLLDESFLQDGDGKWFVPDPKKATDLEAQRTKALLREFATYVEGKGKLSSFRSEAVRAGFKDAWGRRDFAEITAVGERLPADAFVEDESLLYYYDNAKRLTPGI